MTPSFNSADEFREVMDRTFTIMSEDPEIGPRLRDADTPQRFEFEDVDLVVNIRGAKVDRGAAHLEWKWTDDVAWEPQVRMAMASEVANRWFQGKEDVAMAIARRRIRASGDVRAALGILPILKPLFARYRELVAADYPHLEV